MKFLERFVKRRKVNTQKKYNSYILKNKYEKEFPFNITEYCYTNWEKEKGRCLEEFAKNFQKKVDQKFSEPGFKKKYRGRR